MVLENQKIELSDQVISENKETEEMEKITTDQLEPGAVLADDVITSHGYKLLDEGKVLRKYAIKYLCKLEKIMDEQLNIFIKK